ncbi:MAG: HAMP domain-containing histidine kinase [Gammaproteobacteria bacterium]|nr:MAG: HAMP domain-containing histidine kinase [Gammaproteobacteria bacterium]
MKPKGIRSKLVRAFFIQVTVISLVTLVGIYVAYNIVYGVMYREALNDEAAHFWSRYESDPRHSLPDVYNLQGYMAVGGDFSSVPEQYRELAPEGFSRQAYEDLQALVHVSERDGRRLFLVLEYEQVSGLVFFFGIVPLALVLLLIYGTSFVTYRLSQRAVSPIVRLAAYLEEFDFNANREIGRDLDPLRAHADAEVVSMIQAVEHFTTRLAAFVERERIFTRDAGHELRTPVAVFKGSLDLLEQSGDRPAHELKALARMRRTVSDMEALLETLLLLAREEQVEMPREDVTVNAVVAGQLELLQPMAERAENSLALHEHAELRVRAPEKVLEIVLGNLIRNAINYTQGGRVDVTVTDRSVQVGDTGVGMSGEELKNAFEPFYRADESRGVTRGHGLGLAIVKRLVHQAGWSISAHSKPGEGTRVEVAFFPEG